MPETTKSAAPPVREKEISAKSQAFPTSASGASPVSFAALAGNQAVQRLALGSLAIGGGGASVGDPDDPREHEARSVAEQVLGAGSGAAAAGNNENSTRARGALRPLAAGASGGRSGIPLPAMEREFFESRFRRDFSDVRIHTDPQAQTAARQIGARAFTRAQDIYFAGGRWAPGTTAGRRLIAHELTHTLQQKDRKEPLVQADFDTDFAGRSEIRVADHPAHPPGTIQLTSFTGELVWAPYGIYSPQEIPEMYQKQIMESANAYKWRNPYLPLPQQMNAEDLRKDNKRELTVEDMRNLSQGAGSKMNIRLLMAKSGGEIRFVGYDMSTVAGGEVSHGFVESEQFYDPADNPITPSKGVGRALFTDRVVRALQDGVTSMRLEVYLSERTRVFHEDIFRTAGVEGEATEGTKYRLNTRQMVRIVLAWSDGLSDAQRIQLAPLATAKDEPTPAEVKSILQSTGAPGSGAETSRSGFTTGSLEDMKRFGDGINSNIRRPLQVQGLEDLNDPATAQKILAEHEGFASVGNSLYHLQRQGELTQINRVTASLIWQPVDAQPGPVSDAEPGPLAEKEPWRRMVGLDPARLVGIGEDFLENPADFSVKSGDVVIVNSNQTFEARDPKTGRPLIGIFEGGQWYRVVGADGKNQDIEALTTEGVRPVEIGGSTVLAEPFDPEPFETPETAGAGGGAGAAGAAAIGGIFAALNDIMAPIGKALQSQRATIESGKAEVRFWLTLNANPTVGVWDLWGHGPAPSGTKPDTALFGTFYFPYVANIDADALRVQLPLLVKTYNELELLLFSGVSFGAFQFENNRWYACVNRRRREQMIVYDITEAITTVRARTLDTADATLRNQLAARPESERRGRIFRVPRGTKLWRSRGGKFNSQILVDAGDSLGPNALVREIRRTDYTFSTDEVFVEPINADAYQAVALSEYYINRGIEKVWHEVVDGGRSVTPSELPDFGDGPLESFQAGPETTGDRRFGNTSYTKDPENPGVSTIARGEVRAFWVSVDDLEPADEAAVLPH